MSFIYKKPLINVKNVTINAPYVSEVNILNAKSAIKAFLRSLQVVYNNAVLELIIISKKWIA